MKNILQRNFNYKSLENFENGEITVCAHDAGAATHIAAWVYKYHSNIRYSLKGPAINIFKNHFKNKIIKNEPLEETLKSCEVLITGTGWQTDFEYKAIIEAKKRNLLCVSVLDHWVNYKSRFIRRGLEVFPNIIWVADDYAFKIAKKEFPSIEIQKLSNYWLNIFYEKVIKKKESIGKVGVNKPAKKIIYLSEPIREIWPGVKDSKELYAIQYLLTKLPELSKLGHVNKTENIEKIILRPHPSEEKSNYLKFINSLQYKFPICLDPTPDLAESLALVDAAFGCETQALVASMKCGIPSFITLPPIAPECRLPHESLIHLKEIC